jgi:hypothetical protein
MTRKRRALVRDAAVAGVVAVCAATIWKLLAVFLFAITTPKTGQGKRQSLDLAKYVEKNGS